MKILVRDRVNSKQSLADAEKQMTILRKQLDEYGKKIADLNADVASSLEKEAKLEADMQAALAREAADSAAAKIAHEQEIASLRAEISSHPAPDEKCKRPSFFVDYSTQ
jgi:hypothetical protein